MGASISKQRQKQAAPQSVPQQPPPSQQTHECAPATNDVQIEEEVDAQEGEQKDDFKPLSVDLPASLQNRPRGRRGSVSAESDRTERVYKKIVIPKSEEQMHRIRSACKKSILFTGLDREQLEEIFDSMQEVKVDRGETVIKQSETGDYFYVIDNGKFDVLKSENGEEKKVFEYNETGSFGELALMYNCPRAATVVATTPGTLWRVDRETFRHIIIDSTQKKRKLFEQFLESIPILANLSKQERARVADCLETVHFQDGQHVIKQGDTDCDQVYFIVKGQAVATQTAPGTNHIVKVGEMKPGQYFGERSLITREPRAANVIAVGELECAVMDRSAFERLLGDVKEIMNRQIRSYKTADQVQNEHEIQPQPLLPQPTQDTQQQQQDEQDISQPVETDKQREEPEAEAMQSPTMEQEPRASQSSPPQQAEEQQSEDQQ